MPPVLRPPALPLSHPFSGNSLTHSPPTPFNFRRRIRKAPSLPLATAAEVDTFTKSSGYLFKMSESEAESLAEYDVARIGSVYRKKPLIMARRLFQIGTTLGKWFAIRYIDSVLERADTMFKVRAAELRNLLVELGPQCRIVIGGKLIVNLLWAGLQEVMSWNLKYCLYWIWQAYVKIAQAISSRSDLIPPLYLEELSLLQDRITPFSNEVAFRTIEQELGMSIEEIFSEISSEPVAAASLGQVYQARLRTSEEIVAVKVQRPGVKAAIALDIYILRFVVGIVKKAGKFNTDLQAVVDEWALSLFREMDYRKEAKNGLTFRKLYGGLPDVVVPQMYIDKTTQRVLVMEWVEGQKLAKVKDLYLIEVGVYCSFNQLLEYGFYHADPHPGNLLRTSDGKLAYLDFGMMGEFEEERRDGFIEACLHLVNRDFDALARDFITLGLLPPTAEKGAVTKALTGVFQDAVAKGIRNMSFGDLLGDLGITMYKFKFQIPSYFSLVIRSLAVLEGIAISFDPNYKVLGSTYPWIARKVLMSNSPKLKSSLQSLLYKDGVFKIDRLESLLNEMSRARLDKAMVNKKEVDKKLVAKDILSFTLAEQGSFLREIFLEETAKGLDAYGQATINSIVSVTAAYLPLPLPFLSSRLTDEDVVNLRNFNRLVLLVSGLRESGVEIKNINNFDKQTSSTINIYKLLDQLPPTEDIQPVLALVYELPLEQQRQLFGLPAEVLGRLISRVAARTIRRFFL